MMNDPNSDSEDPPIRHIRLGRYVHATDPKRQMPIVVTGKGTAEDDPLNGPWITYHLEGFPQTATTVFYTLFDALMEHGYRHVPKEPGLPLEEAKAAVRREIERRQAAGGSGGSEG